MAIVVSYGPIADALQLASQAGKGQGFNIQANRDLQALQLQNSEQSEIDRTNANLMQNSMAYDSLQSQNTLKQQTMAQQNAYQTAQQQMEQERIAQQGTQYNAVDQDSQDALAEKQREFDAGQDSRQEQADSLTQLRQAQAQKAAQPPNTASASVQANGAALRSMDQQSANTQNQIKALTAALAKASDPYTGNPSQAQALKGQISNLQFSLDGIDPATGQKVQSGLEDQRTKLRGMLQSFGSRMSPNATMSPSPLDPTQMDFENGTSPDDEDNSDPLYGVNNNGVMPVSYQGAAGQPGQQGQPAQAGQAQQGQQGGQATPAVITQLGQQIATQLGQPINSPAVKQAVRQTLQKMGMQAPIIQ